MELHHAVMTFAGLLMLALLSRPLAQRVNIPFAAVLVLAGIVGSLLLDLGGIEVDIEPVGFRDLIFYVLLPALVFDAAYKFDAEQLFRQMITILFLAIPILFFCALVAALTLDSVTGDALLFPFYASLLTGALLSTTDPAAVMPQLERMKASRRLRLLLSGEGVINDATAIVLFSIILTLILNTGDDIAFDDTVVMFCAVFFGGALVGLITGLIFLLLTRLCKGPMLLGLNTLLSAYIAYIAAENLLHVSGVMAVLVTGLVMGRLIRYEYPGKSSEFVENLWSMNSFIAHSLVYLLTGVTLTLALFEDHALAILAGIVGVVLARLVAVFGFVPLLIALPGVEPISRKQQLALAWVSPRGAVTLALALSIPPVLSYDHIVQAIAFGVVLFTLFVQAPTAAPTIRRLGLLDKEVS